MKLVRESMTFKRTGDTKSSLNVGLYSDNLLPLLNETAEKMMKNPTETDFRVWSKLAQKVKMKFSAMILKAAILEEFGEKVKKEGDDFEPIYTVTISGILFHIYPSSTSHTWHAKAYAKRNLIPMDSSYTFPTLAKKIRNIIKNYGY